jgi:hypothetical protein
MHLGKEKNINQLATQLGSLRAASREADQQRANRGATLLGRFLMSGMFDWQMERRDNSRDEGEDEEGDERRR